MARLLGFHQSATGVGRLSITRRGDTPTRFPMHGVHPSAAIEQDVSAPPTHANVWNAEAACH